jgi:exodeoxyribonuclease V alpha subunit
VHKSQGSEFRESCLLLPEKPSALLDRAMVYTALTRARERFAVIGDLAQFAASIRLVCKRNSGCQSKIKKCP